MTHLIRKNDRTYLTIVLAFITFTLFVPSALATKDIKFTGMLRSYTGARVTEGDVPITEQTADFKLEGWGKDTHIVFNPYAYLDAAGTPEIGVREAYIDLYFPSMDIRLGKQAIVWGEAEGVFITDIVSPRDLRSFILADFTEIRMGIPALKADYFAGPFTFEAVWLPRFVPTQQPEADSIWYTEEMRRLDNVAKANNLTLPDNGLDNSEVFGKMSYFGSAVNAELMAGYAWDDNPVLETSGGKLKAFHERYTVTGGSFSTTIGSVVLRSEAAAYLDRAFTKVEVPGDPPTLGTGDYTQLHGLAGIDWSLLGIDMSGQYILKYIHNYDEALLADEYDHTATLRLRDAYLSNTLTWELFGYVGFSPEDLSGSADALLRPSLTYSIEEGVKIKTGAEIFLGDEKGNFGNYQDNSLAYVSLRWYF